MMIPKTAAPKVYQTQFGIQAIPGIGCWKGIGFGVGGIRHEDRKSTRLNSSHVRISYAVFCLKKKKHGALLRDHVDDDVIRGDESAERANGNRGHLVAG